jgi:trimeric autotransporter adhesin
MRKRIQQFLVISASLVGLHNGWSQGTAFTYQGRLSTNGVPYSGSAEFQFTLWDAASAGNTVATNNPTSFIATVDNGLFTVTLDFGLSPFDGQPRFLQTDVRTVIGPFTALSPRQPVTATPYALRALNLTTNGLAAGTYGNVVTFNNAGNSFAGTLTGSFIGAASGDGAGLTNVNATTLGGLVGTSFWKTNGNAGANPTNGAFLGTTDNLPLELRVNGLRALRLEPSGGTPNLIVGANNNSITSATNGTVAGGSNNRIRSTDHSFIAGGDHNEIGGAPLTAFNTPGCNFVGGGSGNYITTNVNNAFVGGGSQCFIYTNSDYSFIGGGLGCRVSQSSPNCAVVGGQGNSVQPNSSHSFVGGGFGNIIFSGSDHAAILGGNNNEIRDNSTNACVGGGDHNKIFAASFGTIPGGFSNRVSGDYAFAAGRRAKADHLGSFVWADSTDADFASTANNQFLIRASGGVGIGTTSPTRDLEVHNAGATEIGIKSTDTGGHLWTLQSSGITGSASLDASFQIIDRTAGGSRLLIGTNGFVGIGTSSPTNRLHVNGGVSATAFVTTSDRNAKENFSPVLPTEVLAKVAALPITKWSFKEMKDGQHLGPMAQDFYAAFGLGGGETTITTVDADGVALAAIQGLNQKLEQKETEIAELKQRLEALEKIILSKKSN